MKWSRTSGSASESRLAARSTGVPCRILRTGTSSFLPDSVRGMPGTSLISSGTCRGDSADRIRRRSSPTSSSVSSAPSAGWTYRMRRPSCPSRPVSMTRLSAISGNASTTR